MMQDRDAFFIGNEWLKPSSSKTFQLVGASTGEVIATVPEAVEADVDRAVAAARAAFDHSGWATMAPAERAIVMRRFMAALATRGADLAQAVSHQNGMPIALSEMLEGVLSG